MSMSKKDYVLLAETLGNTAAFALKDARNASETALIETLMNQVATTVALRLKGENKRFETHRFLNDYQSVVTRTKLDLARKVTER